MNVTKLRALTPFSSNATEPALRTSIFDLIMDPKSDLTDKSRKFLIADRTQALQKTGNDMLVTMHKRSIEFNEKPCEMVFIADRTVDLQLFKTKKLNALDIAKDKKFLEKVAEDLSYTAEVIENLNKENIPRM